MLINRRLRSQKGIAIVEFAVALPLLLLLLGGFIEFGFLLYNKQVITNAAREGARAAINPIPVILDDPDIQKIVDQYCQDRLLTFDNNPNALSVNVSPSDRSFGTDVTVRVTYQYGFLFSSILPSRPLESNSTMRMM